MQHPINSLRGCSTMLAYSNIKKCAGSVSDFVLKVKTIGNSLKAAGQIVSENDLILCMLLGVGRDYDYVVSIVTSQRNSISSQEVQYLLLNHEQTIAQFNSDSTFDISTASANFVTGNQSDKRNQRGSVNGSINYKNGGRWNNNNRPIFQEVGKFKMRKNNHDSLIEKLTPSGQFSVCSFRKEIEARNVQVPSSFSDNALVWSGVVPPKIELFLWLLAKRRLLVGKLLPKFTGGKSLEGCFHAICCSIWESRNDVVFNQGVTDAGMVAEMVRWMVAWWFKNCGPGSQLSLSILMLNLKVGCVDTIVKNKNTGIRWCRPSESDLKFTVDGSSRGNPGPAGIVGILRNHAGVTFCMFSSFLGDGISSTCAEIHAIPKACELCKKANCPAARRIIIESDSRSTIS
ncbi:hypothetical protein Dsin_015603 [Dipteronia sinensis]|uniref:RNase H type-1 domain-containing protein n=1 Tax=Dipteronia sinensis TaxID=43782 RepID=A0AAE0ACS2_9ROSI|nr:hypothetical protein Dsin_015603 [Dipteronia sinensis]